MELVGVSKFGICDVLCRVVSWEAVRSTTSTRFLASEFWWQNDVGWFGQRPAGVAQFSWQENDISKRPKISDALNIEIFIRIRLGSSIHKTWRPTLKSAVRTINNFTYFLFCDSFFICFSQYYFVLLRYYCKHYTDFFIDLHLHKI
jgi:hypothetical protein